MATARIGRRRRHKRHKQRARQRRAVQAFQSTLRHVYAPAALESLRAQRLLMQALRFSGARHAEVAPAAVGQIAVPTAVGRLAAKLQRPTVFTIGDSNLGAR